MQIGEIPKGSTNLGHKLTSMGYSFGSLGLGLSQTNMGSMGTDRYSQMVNDFVLISWSGIIYVHQHRSFLQAI